MTPPPARDRIVVATSLAPGRSDRIQHVAIESWIAAGIRPVSVNAPDEISELEKQFPGLEFAVASRDGRKTAGKPVPFVTDLLAAATVRSGASVIGMINSDIILRHGTQIVTTIATTARGGVVLLPRVDIANAAAISAFDPGAPHRFSTGYDGVFIDGALAAQLPANPFCLGMPFWDYWLPMVAILRGYPLHVVSSPDALHVEHPTAWDGSIYFYFHALASDLIRECQARASNMPDAALGLLADVMASLYGGMFDRGTSNPDGRDADIRRAVLADAFDRIQAVVVHHIKQRAQPIACSLK